MRAAIKQAKKAEKENEVPIGAVLVHKNEIISQNHNKTEIESDPTAHAEILCIREGSKILGWRLIESILYITLEPCPMCAGAILQSRIKKVVFGAHSPLLGSAGSWINILDHENEKLIVHPFHSFLELKSGILEDECKILIRDFFKRRRL